MLERETISRKQEKLQDDSMEMVLYEMGQDLKTWSCDWRDKPMYFMHRLNIRKANKEVKCVYWLSFARIKGISEKLKKKNKIMKD